MALLRAQVVFQSVTGLPKDDVVNTFHVVAPSASDADSEEVAEAVRDFYTVDHGIATKSLMGHIGHSIASTGHEVRIYNINAATNTTVGEAGAPPVWIEPFDFVGRAAQDNGLPAEVAVCLSYRSNESPTVPKARRRGRIFFGPIRIPGGLSADASNVERVSSEIRGNLLAEGVSLRDRLIAQGNEWVIYSRPFAGRGVIERPGRAPLPALAARPGALYRVDQLYVDDAFDTQRRRGQTASVREFSASL